MEKKREIAQILAKRYGEDGMMSHQSIEWLSQILIPIKTLHGDILFPEGTICKYIYYVERGLVRQRYKKKNKILTEHIGSEGSIIMCIESLFNQTPTSLTIECLEPCSLYALPYEDTLKMGHTSFEICNMLLSIIKESLILSQRKADTLRNTTAMERYVLTIENYPDIIHRTPLNIVASYLQMTPETLSRVRSEYHKKNTATNPHHS